MHIKEVAVAEEKSNICNAVLRALPDWFGVERSVVDYAAGVRDKPFYAVFDGDHAIGFAAVKIHNPHTAEIYVMGMLEAYHRCGVGRKLVQICEDFCREHGMEFLTVKTVDESVEDIHYERTRQFYQAMGFKPLEVFPLHWNKDNPCLFLTMHIACR